MSNVLKEYEKNGYHIIEYTRDGETVSASIKSLIGEATSIEQSDPQPTIEEKILAENQYQTMLLELNTLGGV